MVKYVILNTSEVTEDIDFSQLLNRNASMLRYSTNGEKAIVKYDGYKPSFLTGKTTHTHSQILNIVNDTEGEWCQSE